MSDQILLDRIRELENENHKLKARSIRWQTVARNVGCWIREHGDDIGAAVTVIGFFGGIILTVAWFAGGWATDKFYLEFGGRSGGEGACIYQEYDWGSDVRVECSYNISDRPNYVNRIGIIRDEWIKAKNIGKENEQSRTP